MSATTISRTRSSPRTASAWWRWSARVTVDIEAISQIPPVSAAWKWAGWGLPALVLLGLVWIGVAHGAAVAGKQLLFWIAATGGLTAVGAALSLAHPLVVLSS